MPEQQKGGFLTGLIAFLILFGFFYFLLDKGCSGGESKKQSAQVEKVKPMFSPWVEDKGWTFDANPTIGKHIAWWAKIRNPNPDTVKIEIEALWYDSYGNTVSHDWTSAVIPPNYYKIITIQVSLVIIRHQIASPFFTRHQKI